MKTLVCFNYKVFFLLVLFLLQANIIKAGFENPPDFVMPSVFTHQTKPSAAELESFEFPDVDLARGQLNLTIPIYNLSVDGVNVPIFLSYNSQGVKINSTSGIVGQNWSLHAGGRINRNVIGMPDEGQNNSGYFNLPHNERPYDLLDHSSENPQQFLYKLERIKNFLEGKKDLASDEYSFHTPGFSGNFVFQYDPDLEKLKIKTKEKNGNQVLFSVGSASFDQHSFFFERSPIGISKINSFAVLDVIGNRYYFGAEQESGNFYEKKDIQRNHTPSPFLFEHTSGWILNRIITRTNKKIYFEFNKNINHSHYYNQ